jgi:hypothetical protein
MNQVFMLLTTSIFDVQGQTEICHSSEDELIHHIDIKTESQFVEMSCIGRV